MTIMYNPNTTLYLAGAWQQGNGKELTSINPADETIVWQGIGADLHQVELAVTSAKAALKDWCSLSLAERQCYLECCCNELRSRRKLLADLISRESGKPLWEAEAEVQSTIDKFSITYTAYQERCPTRQRIQANATVATRHKPHGVMAVWGPFNMPAHLPNGHIVPALLSGNTVVFKPSQYTPAVAACMAECWHDSGIPAGVFNMVQGGPDVGVHLSECKDLDGLLFTGSWQTAQHLLAASHPYPKRIVALELGGNNPLVVWDVADAHAAAYLIVQSAFLTAGQRCSCARRLVIPTGSKGQRILEPLIALTKKLRIGSFKDNPEPFIGPLINPQAAEHVYTHYHHLLSAGALPLVPMQRHALSNSSLTPSIVDITDVDDVADEEIFGPLLQVQHVSTFEKAIEASNNTSYGLAAGIITDNADLYHIFWQQVHAGIINWNTPLTGASSYAPFGGIGRSGNYRPGAYYAVDYSSYPVASMEIAHVEIPTSLPKGLI
jgi:succinylglutamic semialdehyde dehydrogenase